MENKVTKRDYFNAIRNAVENMDSVGDYKVDDVLNFIDNELEILEKRKNNAHKRAEKKKEEGNQLKEEVFGYVTNEWQTVDAIASNFTNPDVTRAKVIARLTQLYDDGRIDKDQIKLENGNKRMVYMLLNSDFEVEDKIVNENEEIETEFTNED